MITYLDRYSVSIKMVRWAIDNYNMSGNKAFLILAGQGLFDCTSYLLTHMLDVNDKKHVTSDSIEYLCSIALVNKNYPSLRALSVFSITLNTWKANRKTNHIVDIDLETLEKVCDIVADLSDDILADMEV